MNRYLNVKVHFISFIGLSIMFYITTKYNSNSSGVSETISQGTNRAAYQQNITEAHGNVNVCDPIPKHLLKKVKPDPNIRDTTCNCCFPHNFDYLINNKNICKKTETGEDIDLFIMIFTEHIHVKQRQAIRQTWLDIARKNTANVRYVFLLGNVNDQKLTDAVAQENKLYKDILKEDFVDSYRNQTIKTMMGFKWIVNYCHTARYVLKSDDDMFINVPNILRYLRNFGKELKTKMVGSCRQTEPIRYEPSKWYVSEQEYKESLYPPFCAGTAYLNSFTTIEKISKISPYIPFFWLEDIYVSLCFRKIGGTVESVVGFNSEIKRSDICLYKGDTVFTSHEIKPEMFKMIWKAKCKTV